MFKWIKESLFGSSRGYEEGSTVLPKVDNTLPMPEVLPPKNTPDISEPVHVLVANIIKYPHHWKFETQINWEERSSLTSSTIKNLLTGERFIKFEECRYGLSWVDVVSYSENLLWANEDEIAALKGALNESFSKKKKRIDNIKQIKKDNERKRLMELYK